MKGSIELARLICVEIAGDPVPGDSDGDSYGSMEIAEILSAGYERLKAENEKLKAENEALRLENNTVNSELIWQRTMREMDGNQIKKLRDRIAGGVRVKAYIDGERVVADSSYSEKNGILLLGLDTIIEIPLCRLESIEQLRAENEALKRRIDSGVRVCFEPLAAGGKGRATMPDYGTNSANAILLLDE